MNWKSVPYLFANGKFEIVTTFLERTLFVGYYLESDDEWLLGEDLEEYLLDTCTLIARPISDMSDEEIIDVFKDYGFDYDITSIKWNEEGYFTIKTGGTNPSFVQHLYPEKFRWQLVLNMIGIGVYPFEDTTDVEFITKND